MSHREREIVPGGTNGRKGAVFETGCVCLERKQGLLGGTKLHSMDRKEIVTVPKAHWLHGRHCGAPVLAAIESRSCCVLIHYTAWLEKKIVAMPNAHWPHVQAFSVSLPLGLQVAPERKVMVCGIKLYCMDSTRAQSHGVWH